MYRYFIVFKYQDKVLYDHFVAVNEKEAINMLLSFREDAEVISVKELPPRG